MTRSFDAVPALRPGAHVRLIAPASPFPTPDFERGVERLRRRYRVSFDEAITARDGYLAGGDARRLAELRAALEDPTVDAIVAARGGYGVTRLLAALDVTDVRPTLLVGFSDLTALHALWQRAGLRSIHGPMVAGIGRGDEEAFDRWIVAVEGGVPPTLAVDVITPGHASGPLVGGNLSVLCALVGTPFAPPLDGAVLFLEEVGEAPYRVDRMLTTLRHAGWFARVSAIAVGQLSMCDPGPDAREVSDVLHERLHDLGIPVVRGVPSGHEADNLELPLGAPVSIDGHRGELSFGGGATLASA